MRLPDGYMSLEEAAAALNIHYQAIYSSRCYQPYITILDGRRKAISQDNLKRLQAMLDDRKPQPYVRIKDR